MEKEELREELLKQVGGEAAGLSTEVGSGILLDKVTAPLLVSPIPGSRLAYGVINFGGGVVSNYAAQKLRGEEDINYGELITSGAFGVIPGTSLRFAKHMNPNRAKIANRILGKSDTIHRGVAGGIGTGVLGEYLETGWNERKLPSAGDVATGAVVGGTLGGAFSSLSKLRLKYKGKSVDEVNKTITKRERSQLSPLRKRVLTAQRKYLETGDNTEVLMALEELAEANFNFEKSQGLHQGIVDYTHYKEGSKKLRNSLEDLIDGEDPFFTIRHLPDSRKIALNKFIRGYEGRERTNNRLREYMISEQEKGRWTGKQTSSAMRKLAGFIHLEDVVHKTPTGNRREMGLYSIAKLVNSELSQVATKDNTVRRLTVDDVYEYLREQVEGDTELRKALKRLNAYHNIPEIEAINKTIEELKQSGRFTKRTARRLRRALEHAKKKKTFEKGHKEALHNIFLKYTTGGNRLSNMYIQAKDTRKMQNLLGEDITIPGNRALSDKDLPLYTLIKLKGSTRDLKEDFVKTIMPKHFPSESIHEPYWEAAEIMYRNGMDEVEKFFHRDGDYHANVSGYSIALTNGIFEMIKAAEDLDIDADLFEDRFILQIKGIHKDTATHLLNIYTSTINKTLNDLNIKKR